MKDINKLVTENIDLWSSTVQSKSGVGRGSSKKHTLYGIKKLRELILELAVRGKLVPQNPDDEPVSVLLEEIEAERETLLNKKKIRKQKPIPNISNEELPFKLPDGWDFVRFGDVVFNRDAERSPLSVDERKNRQGNYDYYGASGIIDTIDDYLFDSSLLLIGEDGANLINRSTPIAFLAKGKYWVNNHAHVIDGLSIDLLNYLSIFINAISLESYITGTAQPKMNQVKMNSIIIALPPINEQIRIVKKVDELMALCDQLEKQTEDSLTAHQALVETLLDTLIQSQNPDDLTENWNRISDYFDMLFTTEKSIDSLKQTILQLAVMGKLVPQDPDDEPASVLLEKIAVERESLIKKKKIRTHKPIPSINNKEFPFKLPNRWSFARFGDVVFNRDAERIPLSVDERKNRQGSYDYYGASGIIDTIDDYLFDSSLLLIGEDGANLINRSTPIAFIARGKFWVNNHAHVIDGLSFDLLNYISLFINAISLEPYITGTAQPKMNQVKMNSIIIALPPSNEQKRIVQKVDELLVLCDKLKSNLAHAQETQLNLTNAIVEKAVG